MPDKNEMVRINPSTRNRIDLKNSIDRAISKKKIKLEEKEGCSKYDGLDFGMTFEPDWPIKGEVTLAQLTVMARKLEVNLNITAVHFTERPKTK